MSNTRPSNFIRGIFLEDEKPSFARIACAFVILMSSGWITFSLIYDRKLPDLAGITLYTSSLVGVVYGANKAKEIFAPSIPK